MKENNALENNFLLTHRRVRVDAVSGLMNAWMEGQNRFTDQGFNCSFEDLVPRVPKQDEMTQRPFQTQRDLSSMLAAVASLSLCSSLCGPLCPTTGHAIMV